MTTPKVSRQRAIPEIRETIQYKSLWLKLRAPRPCCNKFQRADKQIKLK